MIRLHATQQQIRRFVRRQVMRALYWALGAGAVSTVILVIDYRLMILTVIAMAVPLVLAIVALRLRRELGSLLFCELELGDAALEIRSSASSATVPLAELINVRIFEDHLVVAQRTGPAPRDVRGFTIPGDDETVRRIGEALGARGVQVVVERRVGAKLLAIFAGALLWKILGVAAAGLVLGAIANLVLALTGGDGSLFTAGLCFGGALLCMTGVALVRIFLTNSGPPQS